MNSISVALAIPAMREVKVTAIERFDNRTISRRRASAYLHGLVFGIPADAAPTITLAVEMKLSLEPSNAALSQPIRSTRWLSA